MSGINIRIEFSGPDAYFIEIENEAGASIKLGTNIAQADGTTLIHVTLDDFLRATQHPGNCVDCGHTSDCALHNAPAMPLGPCDCGRLAGESDDDRAGVSA
jgi:hypothetical protein